MLFGAAASSNFKDDVGKGEVGIALVVRLMQTVVTRKRRGEIREEESHINKRSRILLFRGKDLLGILSISLDLVLFS